MPVFYPGGNNIAVPGSTAIENTPVIFSNSNGVTFGLDTLNGILTASVNAGGGGVAFSAGTNSRSTGTVVFANSNGVSFGMDTNGNVTATVQPGAAAGLAAVSAGTQQQTSGTLLFNNGNGITFGMSNSSVITASHNGITQQSTQPVAASGSNGSFAFSTLSFGGSNGMTFYTTNGSIVGSYTVPTQSVQTQNMVSVQGSTGAVVFSNSNGITFGFNASTITASHNGLTSQSNQAFSGSNGSSTFQTISFGGSNGMSFYLTNGSLVGSYTVPTQSNQPVAVSGSNGSFAYSTLSMGSSNGMHFYTTNGSIVGSYTVPTQSVQTQNMVSVQGSTGAISFGNANGITFGFNASTVTASHNGITQQSTQPVAASGSNGSFAFSTLSFGGSNGMSFYTTNGSLVGSYTVPTVPAQTNQTLGIYAVGNTTGASSSSTYDARSLSIQGAGNISVGWTNGSLVISQTGGGGGITNINVSAGTTSNNLSNIVFANSNGVSFGLNGSTITASAVGGGGGAAIGMSTDGNTSGNTGTFTSGTVVLAGSNSLTVQQSTGAGGVHTLWLKPAMSQLAAGNNMTLSSNGSTVSVIGMAYANSNGITFGTNAGTLTASHNGLTSQSNQAVSGSNGSFTFQTLTFGNLNNISFYTSNGSIVASAAGGGGAAISAGTNSRSSGTVQFANSNGVTFGMDTNGVVTATVTPGAAAGIAAISAGTTQATNNTVVFNNAGGVSFGMNGNTITAAAGAGGGYTAFTYQNRQLGASTNTVAGQNSLWLVPMRIAGAPVSASTLLQMMSFTGSVTSNQTNTVGLTMQLALYKYTGGTNSSRLDTVWTGSMGLTAWNSGTASASFSVNGIGGATSGSSAGSNILISSLYGLRQLTFTIGSTLDTGLYAYGFLMSTSSAGNSSVLRSFNPVIDNPLPVAMGFINSATNQSIGYVDGGTYSVTTGALPASFNLTEIRQTNNAVPYVKIGAI